MEVILGRKTNNDIIKKARVRLNNSEELKFSNISTKKKNNIPYTCASFYKSAVHGYLGQTFFSKTR
jgi:hypothetical protein